MRSRYRTVGGLLTMLATGPVVGAGAANTVVPLTCQGLASMRVLFADYGLVTRQGPVPGAFEVGTVVRPTRLPDGEPVAVWQFADGGRLYRVQPEGRYFFAPGFVPEGVRARVLEDLRPCLAGPAQALQPTQLPLRQRQP